jgi:hypothetical protein
MRRRRVGDGRNRRRVSISKSDAKDLDTRGTNRCRLRDGCGIAPKLRTLSPIREQEKHLGSYAPATARPEHGQPGCEAAAYGGPALCVLMREAISMHSENGPSVSRRAPPDEGHNQHALRGARPTCALARAASAEPAFWVRLDKMIAC